MSSETIMIASGIIVIGSRWSTGKTVTTKMVIGGLFAMFGVVVITDINAKLGVLFAALILATVLLTDGLSFFKAIGKA